MRKPSLVLAVLCFLMVPASALASGFGVFTQGASGLGQANAVVAHPTGPSSLYFNPALLNDVPGRQIEVGTTGVYADRKIKLSDGGAEDGENSWNFPSTFYYTHQANEKITSGIGIFFPFGLSTEWGDNYAGKYLGTSAAVFSMNINPAISFRVNDKLSLAAGIDLLYLDATLENKIPQYLFGNSGPYLGEDISQKFEGDGWGHGFNLGLLYKATDRISIGATYRSHIDVDVEGDASFRNVDPGNPYAVAFLDATGSSDIRLPAQATVGVAVKALDNLVVEVGVRWEDWDSTDDLEIVVDNPYIGAMSNSMPRDWQSTWSYNIGGQYKLNETVAINAGYLYGQNAVPSSTLEPLIPDTDAHLFTIGTDLTFGAWTVSGAFGYEYHEDRDKVANQADAHVSSLYGYVPPLEGEFQTDIYLVGLSLGYRF